MGYDVIGDVHGCLDELLELLHKLGHRIFTDVDGTKTIVMTGNRKILFVGDLNDRGPDSLGVFKLVDAMVKADKAESILGNHDWKLLRYLSGRNPKLSHGLQGTVDQIEAAGAQDFVREFLEKRPLTFSTGEIACAHGAWTPGVSAGKFQSNALYGVTTGKQTPEGFPERDEAWKQEAKDKKVIFVGHTPTEDGQPQIVTSKHGTIVANLDTGCCFGGNLTAYRYPEGHIVQVPAKKVYVSRKEVQDFYKDKENNATV